MMTLIPCKSCKMVVTIDDDELANFDAVRKRCEVCGMVNQWKRQGEKWNIGDFQ